MTFILTAYSIIKEFSSIYHLKPLRWCWNPGHNLPNVSLIVPLGHSTSSLSLQPFVVRKEVSRNLHTTKSKFNWATQLLNLYFKFQWLLLNVKEENRNQYLDYWKMECQIYPDLTFVRWNLSCFKQKIQNCF